MSVFAQRLEELLAQNNMTAAELSRKTGIPESAISNYRAGKYEAKQRRLEQLSKALHTTPAYLMGWEMKDADSPSEKDPLADQLFAAYNGGKEVFDQDDIDDIKMFMEMVAQRKRRKQGKE